MDDEGFVPDVDDATDAVAGVEGRRRPRVVLDRSVVVAVLDLLRTTTLRYVGQRRISVKFRLREGNTSTATHSVDGV